MYILKKIKLNQYYCRGNWKPQSDHISLSFYIFLQISLSSSFELYFQSTWRARTPNFCRKTVLSFYFCCICVRHGISASIWTSYCWSGCEETSMLSVYCRKPALQLVIRTVIKKKKACKQFNLHHFPLLLSYFFFFNVMLPCSTCAISFSFAYIDQKATTKSFIIFTFCSSVPVFYWRILNPFTAVTHQKLLSFTAYVASVSLLLLLNRYSTEGFQVHLFSGS